MTARSYVHVRYPWRAIVEANSPAAVTLYARLIDQGLGYGLPAKRFGRAGAAVARRGLPRGVVAGICRAGASRPAPDVDAVVDDLVLRWSEVGDRLTSVPDPSTLAVLGLHRSGSLTVFLVDAAGSPVVVGKIPRGEASTVALEVKALRRSEPAGVAPLHLGSFGGASVQQGIAGTPLGLEPLSPGAAGRLSWLPEHEEVTAALTRLGAVTVASTAADELTGWLDRAAAHPSLMAGTRAAVSAAAADLGRLDRSVLRHGDTSVQNCLMRDGTLAALVDWELAKERGVPGFDILNFAIAYLEHCIGLKQWSPKVVVGAFDPAWRSSPFMERARSATRTAAVAADVPERFHESLQVAFFARRLGRRLADPGRYATGPESAARMLERVCEY